MKRIALIITVMVSMLAGSVSLIVASWTAAAAALPYPPSQLITGLTWDSAVVKFGDGTTGDNWPVTWADDDAIYTTWGDEFGFEPKVERKLSLGFGQLPA